VSASFDYDAELRRYHVRLLAAADIAPDAHVLDIGCGAGQTTRAAARTAYAGDAFGVDISAPLLARARQLTDDDGIVNARFEVGDAQIHPLPAKRFTVGISRFGTMFFTDPVAAFANIAQSLKPGARFVQLVWQNSSRQEWIAVVGAALAGEPGSPPAPTAAAAFSLADPATVDRVLTAAGFVDVALVELREPVYYGADRAGALDAIRSLFLTGTNLDDAASARVIDRLRILLDANDADDGVWFDSCAWLVTARTPPH
jgi:SAM-dependent methyltransferase